MTKPLSHERLEAEEHWCEYMTNMKNHPDWKPFDNDFIDKSLKDMMRFAYISGFLTGRKHGIAYPDRLEGGEMVVKYRDHLKRVESLETKLRIARDALKEIDDLDVNDEDQPFGQIARPALRRTE